MQKNKSGFTLVELLVIVVILSILSTVGFVSYVDYLQGARDGSRIQQVTGIFNAIQLSSARSKIPLARDITQIRYGSNLIGYQGDIDSSVLEKIEYAEGGRDPKTLDFYSYFVSSDRKSAQILTYFEDISSIKSQINENVLLNPLSSYAIFDEELDYGSLFNVDYSVLHPFVYGFELGILTEEESKAPVHKNILFQNDTLDLFSSTGSYSSYLSNYEIINGSGDDFLGIIPRTDCSKLQELLGGITTGIYKINPSGVKAINTYCNMDIDGGGWTLVGRSTLGGGSDFGWLSTHGNVFNDDESYAMGSDVKDIRFKEILLTTYTSGKNISSAVKLTIDDIFFNSNIAVADDTTTGVVTNCQIVLTGGLVDPCNDSSGSGSVLSEWGKFSLNNTFWTGYDDTFSGALMSNGYTGSIHLGSGSGDSFHGKQGMIFIK